VSSRILIFGGVLAVAFGAGILSWMSLAHVDDGRTELAKAEADSGSGPIHGEDHGEGGSEAGHNEALRIVKLTDQQIAAANISVLPVRDGKVVQRLVVPGTIAMDSDRIGRVAANVVGTVVELRKKLGDPAQKNEVVAVLESREVADARGEYLSALVTYELQSTLFERDRSLWLKQFTPEQQFLRTRTAFTEARVRVNLARQKLLALNLDSREIDETLGKQASATIEAKDTAIPTEGTAKSLRRYELRAPIAGRVVERRVDLGAPVGREGLESEIYVIADLTTVWVELSVPAANLEKVEEGQLVTVKGGSSPRKASGKIIFISPMLTNETRSARVIAAIGNQDLIWHPGTFVTAEIAVDEQAVERTIPIAAIQKFNGESSVFVRTREGFERRDIAIGQQDGETAEVVSGLNTGEQIAVSNTFTLKAELGKASAEHSD
jgi:membrane fusion protein, heavy metal efflux system